MANIGFVCCIFFRLLSSLRFAPVSSDADVTLYWIRTNSVGSDNAAIQHTPLDTQYSVTPEPRSGSYDLHITNTSFTRDNAVFKCMMKQAGTGKLLHTSKVSVTVLVRPGPPVISPRTPVATEGETMNLTCSSEGGSPPPDMFWYMEGHSDPLHGVITMIGRTTTSTLEIVPKKVEDGTSYRCTVWNRAMGQRQRLDTATRIHVKYFPRVSVGPYNPLMVEEGDTAAMLCEVDSNPRVSSVRWTRAGRYIATTFRHVIPTLGVQDTGLYTCEADNDLGRVGRAQLNVSVLHGPRVTLDKLQEIDQNANVNIECKTSANPAPTSFIWTKIGDSRFREEGKYLMLRNVSYRDSGEYACAVTNVLTPTHGVSTSRTSNGTTLIAVNHSPGRSMITSGDGTAGEVVGVAGKALTMSCQTTPPGYPPPQFKWWRSDNPSEILGTQAQLTLQTLELDDSGSYSCKAYNVLGRGQEGSGLLRVLQVPRIMSSLPQEMVRRAGETGVFITCQARGKPAPLVQWRINNVNIDDDQQFLYTVNTTTLKGNRNDDSVIVVSTLYFRGSGRRVGGEVLESDAGVYQCVFVNSAGNTSSQVRIRIEHTPSVLEDLSDLKVAADVGESIRMGCGVRSYPQPEFTWSRDTRSNVVTTLGRIMTQRDTQVSDTEFRSTFTIASVKQSHYGEFLCQASNSIGSSVHVVHLVKKSRPDAPTLLGPVESMSDSLLVKWKENFHGGYKNVTFKLQYRPQDSTILYAKERLCFRNPCKISGLTQHTTYIIRAKALNRLGESQWSDYSSMTTLIDIKKIPRVSALQFNNASNVISFQAAPYPLYLVAKIEALMNSSWQLIKTIPLKKPPYEYRLPGSLSFKDLRVSLCVETNPSLCGTSAELNSDNDREAVPRLSSTDSVTPDNWMVGVVVGVMFTLVASLMVLVKCCWCSSARRRDKMSAAEREKQIIMARPDILHPIDEKMLELTMSDSNGVPGHHSHTRSCAHHSSGLYTNNITREGSQHSDDSVWWIKHQQHQQLQQQQHDCGCDCQFGGGMRDAMSLPHLASPQVFRHVAPQYYSQDLLYGTVPRRIIREIVV